MNMLLNAEAPNQALRPMYSDIRFNVRTYCSRVMSRLPLPVSVTARAGAAHC